MLNAAARLMLVLQFIIRSMLSVMNWLGTALAELHKIHKIYHIIFDGIHTRVKHRCVDVDAAVV